MNDDNKSAVAAPPLTEALEQSAFMKACRKEPASHTPVWIMRQAGRYMKEYRDVREKVSFLELCKTPELAAEVTLTAQKRLGVDAAIIFADILLILEPMGIGLEFTENKGPQMLNPVSTPEEAKALRPVEVKESLPFVLEAIRLTREGLPPDIPLLGFCGAPFTLAAYMIEGGGSKNYAKTKAFMFQYPETWHGVMERMTDALADYLNAQIEAGAQAVQVFDSWIGNVGPEDCREFVLPHSKALISRIAKGVPVIHFGFGTGQLLSTMKEAGGDVMGVDFNTPIDQAWQTVGEGWGVQGNLDPCVLFADRDYVLKRTRRVLDQVGGRPGHIFNLGHGILPKTPVDNAIAMVDFIHKQTAK